MTKTLKKYEKLAVKKLEKSRLEITGTVPVDFFDTFRKKALEGLNEAVKIDGFRKGKVPENVLVSKVGEMAILEEMAELALSQVYPAIIMDEKIDALGRPEIQITKIAAGSPLEFKIFTAVVPEVKLGDYKKISKEAKSKKDEKVEISDKEVEDAILNIRRSRVDHSSHAHNDKMTPEEHTKLVDAALPEFNDEFVKSLGNFKDVADFKEKVRTMLAEEKVSKEKDKKRITISDKLIETSTIDVPEILITGELRRIEAQFADDVARMGVKVEDYLQHAKKTIEDLRKEWAPHAEKKAKLQLVLNKIAEAEKIKATVEEVEKEVAAIVGHYADADRERAAVYAETVLTNEKVFEFLEEGK